MPNAVHEEDDDDDDDDDDEDDDDDVDVASTWDLGQCRIVRVTAPKSYLT